MLEGFLIEEVLVIEGFLIKELLVIGLLRDISPIEEDSLSLLNG